MRRGKTAIVALLALALASAMACAPTIYLARGTMNVQGGGGRDSATEFHAEPTPIQVGVVEAILADEKVWPMARYYDTVLYVRKNKPDVSFFKKPMVDGCVKTVDDMIGMLQAEGVPEAEIDGKRLQKLFAKIAAPHIAQAIREKGWCMVTWGGMGPNKEGTMLDIGPGGGGYFTPYPKQQEVAVHISTEISAGGWKHFTYDVSKIEACFAAPDSVSREQAAAALVLQDDGGAGK